MERYIIIVIKIPDVTKHDGRLLFVAAREETAKREDDKKFYRGNRVLNWVV